MDSRPCLFKEKRAPARRYIPVSQSITVYRLSMFMFSCILVSISMEKNKGPDNPTSQLLRISRNRKFQRDGEGRIDKGGGGGSMS